MNFSTLGNIPPPFNNIPVAPPPSPYPACPICAVCSVCPVCPSPLDGLSCVRWGNTQKLSVGIIGGCLAGIMCSVAITMALLKKQYKFKKIARFMEEIPEQSTV
jgi:hypothetical protein